MSKRNRREHGRIISVETKTRGDALAADVAAAATSITVNDAGDFDEDGGWLYIGAQTVEYTECDDDTGVITLATALTAAGEQGDPVHVWSDLYGEVVDYQQALVELDGEYDNPDPVVAEVAEGVGDLPEGDRGKAGESCTLLRVADDEWEVVGVGGRPRSASGSGGALWEANDSYTLTADDITAGTATAPLSHRPDVESVDARWRTTPQEPTEYTVNYNAKTVTWPLSGFEAVGDRLWFHYTYRSDITTPNATPAPVPFTVTGASHVTGNSISGLALPAGTQVGDLLILTGIAQNNGGSGSFTVTDSRFTKLVDIDNTRPADASVWIGYASSLGAISLTGTYGGAGVDECRATVVALRPTSPSDTLAVDTARVVVAGTQTGNTVTLPALAGAGSGAVAVVAGSHGIGSVALTGLTPYSIESNQGTYSHIVVGSIHAAPVVAGSATFNAALSSNAVVIGLV